jgi:hypothetical protein
MAVEPTATLAVSAPSGSWLGRRRLRFRGTLIAAGAVVDLSEHWMHALGHGSTSYIPDNAKTQAARALITLEPLGSAPAGK